MFSIQFQITCCLKFAALQDMKNALAEDTLAYDCLLKVSQLLYEEICKGFCCKGYLIALQEILEE